MFRFASGLVRNVVERRQRGRLAASVRGHRTIGMVEFCIGEIHGLERG
jgi:hypothetical protein